MDLLEFYCQHKKVIDVLADQQCLFILGLIAELKTVSVNDLAEHVGQSLDDIEPITKRLSHAGFIAFVSQSPSPLVKTLPAGKDLVALIELSDLEKSSIQQPATAQAESVSGVEFRRAWVVLADDHAMFRQGLRALLQEGGFQLVAEASDGRQAVQLCAQHHPEVAILDVGMPVLNGIYAAREIIKSNPRTRVVLLTQHTEDQVVLESLRAGVTGYVLKTRATSELVPALRAVCRGEMYLTQSISRTIVQTFLMKDNLPEKPLSDRERQVLQMVAEGKTTKEIASLLGISVNTAESHRTSLMEKLDIHDTASLVRYALRNRV